MNANDGMTELEITKLQIEAWKTTVEVQQHFNDIGMRIRTIFLTLLAALFGTAAGFWGHSDSAAPTAGVVGLASTTTTYILWVSFLFIVLFWFMDAIWYHQYLIGAVKAGTALEETLSNKVPGVSLTRLITEASHKLIFGLQLTTERRLHLFYCALAYANIVALVTARFQSYLLAGAEVVVGLIIAFILVRLRDKRLSAEARASGIATTAGR